MSSKAFGIAGPDNTILVRELGAPEYDAARYAVSGAYRTAEAAADRDHPAWRVKVTVFNPSRSTSTEVDFLVDTGAHYRYPRVIVALHFSHV